MLKPTFKKLRSSIRLSVCLSISLFVSLYVHPSVSALFSLSAGSIFNQFYSNLE